MMSNSPTAENIVAENMRYLKPSQSDETEKNAAREAAIWLLVLQERQSKAKYKGDKK